MRSAVHQGYQWWARVSCDVPFIKDIKEAIVKVRTANPYLRPSKVLILKIRNKIFKAQNDTKAVRLAFEKEDLDEGLRWCLPEIQKGIVALNEDVPASAKEKTGQLRTARA